MKAIDQFEQLEQGIWGIIKAADVYLICLVAELRREQPALELIHEILSGNTVSTLTLVSTTCTTQERDQLIQKGHVQAIAGQIVLATYTALEIYLAEKFREYFRFSTKGIHADGALDKFSFRSLDNIKDLFRNVLGIHLPLFEIDRITVDSNSSFKPSTSWEGIKDIEKARHDIAHQGSASFTRIALVPDAWDRFDFARRWISLFDANFDFLVYEARDTHLIRSYKERISNQVKL